VDLVEWRASYPRDGWAYDFDRENNLVRVSNLFFYENGVMFFRNPPGYDGVEQSYRFDSTDLLTKFYGDATETRFVRR
jgi:hypothetical protein